MAITYLGTFDESGKFHDKDMICLCGFVSGHENWNALINRWQLCLEKHGIPFLHMAELMTWRDVYQKKRDVWGNHGRDQVVLEFIDLVNTYVGNGAGIGVAIGLDTGHYKAMASDKRKTLGNPALIVFRAVLAEVFEALSFQSIDADYRIGLVFDDEEQIAMESYKLLGKLRRRLPEFKTRIGSICFADDEICLPLQAADMFAYITFSELIRRRTDPKRPISVLFKKLISETDNQVKLLSPDQLDRLAILWASKKEVETGSTTDLHQ